MTKSLVLAVFALGIVSSVPVAAGRLSTAPTTVVMNSDDGVLGTVAQSDASKKKKKKKSTGAGSGSDQRGS